MKRKKWKNKLNVNFLMVCSINEVTSCKSLIINCYKFGSNNILKFYKFKIVGCNNFNPLDVIEILYKINHYD